MHPPQNSSNLCRPFLHPSFTKSAHRHDEVVLGQPAGGVGGELGGDLVVGDQVQVWVVPLGLRHGRNAGKGGVVCEARELSVSIST